MLELVSFVDEVCRFIWNLIGIFFGLGVLHIAVSFFIETLKGK